MAFALTLFVQAANQSVPPQKQSQETGADEDGCSHLYDALCRDHEEGPTADVPTEIGHETSLHSAFNALCSFYVNDPLQAAICARVLAFYFLMERSAGAALDGWLRPSDEAPELVILHPAVVDAIATVTLNGSAMLSKDTLMKRIAAFTTHPEHTH